MSEEKIDPGKSSFILPIICPKCGEEVSLEIDFNLLSPKKLEENQDESIIEEN